MKTSTTQAISMAVVILAAGRSSRMGRPKLLLPWGKTTVLGRLVELWSQLPAEQIVVVLATGDAGMEAELDRLGFPVENRVVNSNPARGMFSSIQCAAQWKGWRRSLTHWAVALGDQPHLQSETLSALAQFAAQSPGKICQPARNGHGKHPVVLPKCEFEKLAGFKEGTLKDFLQVQSEKLSLLEVTDPALDLQMNTPEEYEVAWEMFSKNNA